MTSYPSLNVGYPRVKGRKGCPFDQSESGGKRNIVWGSQDDPREVELPCITTSPCKVGDRSLATFRTSVIFENDRATAEVPLQC